MIPLSTEEAPGSQLYTYSVLFFFFTPPVFTTFCILHDIGLGGCRFQRLRRGVREVTTSPAGLGQVIWYARLDNGDEAGRALACLSWIPFFLFLLAFGQAHHGTGGFLFTQESLREIGINIPPPLHSSAIPLPLDILPFLYFDLEWDTHAMVLAGTTTAREREIGSAIHSFITVYRLQSCREKSTHQVMELSVCEFPPPNQIPGPSDPGPCTTLLHPPDALWYSGTSICAIKPFPVQIRGD